MITFSGLGDSKWGRLGNQLFHVASTIGIAHNNNQIPLFPPWKYAQYFKSPLPVGYLHKAQKYKHESIEYKEIILPEGNWDLEGFFTSEKYFSTIAQTIRDYFAPADHVENYLQHKYGLLLKEGPCSIHVRRGDYLKQSWDFPSQPISYYQYAISKFKPETNFLVFSDDIAWCKQHFMGSNFLFVENEIDIIDLFLMSRCRNHIISNSTFSWWGAWLNPCKDKTVLCPPRWFGPGVSSKPGQFINDLYADGFQALTLPWENKLLIKIYYFITHPILLAWSVMYSTFYKSSVVKWIKTIHHSG